MSRLQDIIRKKEARKSCLKDALRDTVRQLIDMGALKIIVFGSFSKDNVDVNSDLDLFVVMPSSKTGKEWMDLIYDIVDRKAATDIIVYNLKEFQDKLPKSYFLKQIVTGKVVYEKAG